MTTTYHHGDLRAQVLGQAARMIARDGPQAFSLRAVAAELGVSHTAPRHHFGSREGVFTALAVEGYGLLGDALDQAASQGFAEVGAAYVDFAVTHPGHFAVMHDPDLVDGDDPDLVRASRRTSDQLEAGVATMVGGSPQDRAVAAVAAWSLVHGLATLTLSGALDAGDLAERAGGDQPSLVLRAARLLFPEPHTRPTPHRPETSDDPVHH